MLKITYTGLEDMRELFASLPDSITEGMRKATKEAAVVTKDVAKRKCPVRTGKLRKSIFYEVKGTFKFVVGAKTNYATYVEYGTTRMRAQPYIRPAFIQVTRELPAYYGKAIRAEIQKI